MQSLIFFTAIVFVSGCQIPKPASMAETKAVADAVSMTQTSENNWHILCKDGSTEHRTTAEILENNVCGTNSPAQCIAAACSLMHSSRCDESSEIELLNDACKGSSGECLTAACSKMHSSRCDDTSEIEALLKACKGNPSKKSCMLTACGFMDSSRCDEEKELIPLLQSCDGPNKESCLKEVCKRVNKWDCDEPEEISTILKGC